jgi:hypothetical protein
VAGLLAVGLAAVGTTSAPAARAAGTPSFAVPAALAIGFAVAVPEKATPAAQRKGGPIRDLYTPFTPFLDRSVAGKETVTQVTTPGAAPGP